MGNCCLLLLAEHVVKVEYLYPEFEKFAAGYLYQGEKKPDFTVTVTPELLESEKEKALKTAAYEKHRMPDFRESAYEVSAVCRATAEELLPYGVLLMHGAALEMNSEAVIFTAKSGTGKTTHASLWQQVFGSRVRVINGDKPFLHIGDEGVTVYGSPWCGKEGVNTNVSAPLRAVCILERGMENEICEIPFPEALPMLIQQSYRPRDAASMRKVMQLLAETEGNVRFFRLKCLPDTDAALTSYRGIFGELPQP